MDSPSEIQRAEVWEALASTREAYGHEGTVDDVEVYDAEGRLMLSFRALLDGAMLDMAVAELPDKAPVTARVGTADEHVFALMQKHSIQAVIMVDDAARPVGIVGRRNFEPGVLLSPPHIGEAETTFVQQAFDDNWVAPAGPNLAAFEARLRDASGRSEALALSSGTAALHLAMRLLNIGRGDRVYVSDLTFIGSHGSGSQVCRTTITLIRQIGCIQTLRPKEMSR